MGFVASSFSGSTRNIIKLEKASVGRTQNLFAARGASIYAMNKVAGVSVEEEEEEEDEEENIDEELDEFEEETDEDDEDLEGLPMSQSQSRSTLQKNNGGMMSSTTSKTTEKDKGTAGASTKEAEEQQPWLPNLTPYSVFVGDRACKVYIEDESGKININAIDDKSRELMVKYLTWQKFDRVEADTITDSILDWKDKDDLKHLNGAETDYYESLPEPYEAKNAPFDSIEELALVKEMTPAKFDIIRRDITTYGSNLAININFASKEVLMAIPRITPEGADYIIAQRTQNGPLKSMEDVRNSFWHLGIIGSSFEEVRPYITVDNSGSMTIRASCEANGVSSTYRVIISKANNNINVLAVYPDY